MAKSGKTKRRFQIRQRNKRRFKRQKAALKAAK